MDYSFWLNLAICIIIFSFPGELITQIKNKFCISPFNLKRKKVPISSKSFLEHLLLNFILGITLNSFFILFSLEIFSILIDLNSLIVFDIITLIFSVLLTGKNVGDLLIGRTIFSIFQKIKVITNYIKEKISRFRSLDNKFEIFNGIQIKKLLNFLFSIFLILLLLQILGDLFKIYSEIQFNIFNDTYTYVDIARDLIEYGNVLDDPFNIKKLKYSHLYVAIYLQFFYISPQNWVFITMYLIPSIHMLTLVGLIYVILNKISGKLILIPFLLIFGQTFLPSWILIGLPSTWILILWSVLFLVLFDKKNSSLISSIIILSYIFLMMPSGFVISFVPLIVSYLFISFVPYGEKRLKYVYLILITIGIFTILYIFFNNFEQMVVNLYPRLQNIQFEMPVPWDEIRWDKYSLETIFKVACFNMFPLLLYNYIIDKYGLKEKNLMKYSRILGYLIFSFVFYVFLLFILSDLTTWANFTKIPYPYYRYFIFVDWIYLIIIPFIFVMTLDAIYLTTKYVVRKYKTNKKFIRHSKNRVKFILAPVLILLIAFPGYFSITNYKEIMFERWKENSIEMKFNSQYFFGLVPLEIPAIFTEITEIIDNGSLVMIDYYLTEPRVIDAWFKNVFIESRWTSNWFLRHYSAKEEADRDYIFNRLKLHVKSLDPKPLGSEVTYHHTIINVTMEILNKSTDYLIFDNMAVNWLGQRISSHPEDFEVIKTWRTANNIYHHEMEIMLVEVLN